MVEHFKRHFHGLLGTHTVVDHAALVTAKYLGATAGITESIAKLIPHAESLGVGQLTADRVAAMVDLARIGRQALEITSAQRLATGLTENLRFHERFDQVFSLRDAIEGLWRNSAFAIDDGRLGGIGRAASELSGASSSIKEAISQIGIGDLATGFAKADLARYSAVLDSLSSSLKNIRTRTDFQEAARAVLHQANEIDLESFQDITRSDKAKYEKAGLLNQLTPFERLETRHWVFSALLMVLLWGIDRYFPVGSPEAEHRTSVRMVKPPYAHGGRSQVFVVKGDHVNVRSGPGSGYQKVHSVSHGDIVLKVKQRGPWCQVQHNIGGDSFVRGWVQCRYLRNVDLMVGDLAISLLDEICRQAVEKQPPSVA